MLVINLECVLVLAGLHEGIGESGDGGEIVVDSEQLAGQRAGIGESAGLQVGLEQIAQAIGIGIEIGDFLERCDGGIGVAGLEQIAALHQQGVAVAGIERQHALQTSSAPVSEPCERKVSAAAEKICQASVFLPRRT